MDFFKFMCYINMIGNYVILGGTKMSEKRLNNNKEMIEEIDRYVANY